jgi:signal transduction histidine kinase
VLLRIKLFLLFIAYQRRGNRLQRYALPFFLLAITLFIKIKFYYLFASGTPFLLIPFVIILSAWYGGFGPGIFATFLSVFVADFLFLSSVAPVLSQENIVRMIVFFIEGFLISVISEAQKQEEIQKNQFIGFMSHELKNPLAVIKGYTDMIHQRALKKNDLSIMRYTIIVNTYIQTITILINDLLDITSIETGKFIYRDNLFPIYSLIKEIVQHEQRISKNHTIELKGKTKRYLYADAYRIEQVLTNLLSNAKKYSPDANKIIVTIKDITKGVEISVKDFGIGLQGENKKKIFRVAYRTLPVQQSNIKGSGFGLYISTQIIRHYKGKLWYTSALGKGTTFYLQLYNIQDIPK